MAFGIDIDFNAQVGKLSNQVDKISNDLGKFERKAESVSKKVKTSLSTLGVGLSVAGLTAFVKNGINAADAMSKLSSRTGIAVESLTGLKLAADLSDTNIDTLGRSVNRLSINIAQNREEFEKLGISAKDPTEAFLQFADVFSSIENAQDRAAFGAKVLGRSYADLAPLLNQGSAAIREQVRQGSELSGLTQEQADKAAAFNDELTKLSATMQGFQTRISIGILQPLSHLAISLDENIKKFGFMEGLLRGFSEGYRNFALSDTGGGLSKELDDINKKLGEQKFLLMELRKGDASGGAEREISVSKEINELLEKRQKIIKDLSQQRKQKTDIPEVDVSAFIKTEESINDADKALKAMEASAKKVFEQTRTPLEQYNSKVAELNVLLEKNMISEQTYARAVNEARAAIQGKTQDVKELTDSEAFQVKQLQDSLAIFEKQAALDLQNPYLQAQGLSDQEASRQLQKAQEISNQIALVMGETPVPLSLTIPESALRFPELDEKKVDLEIKPMIDADSFLSKIKSAVEIAQQQIQPLIIPVTYQATNSPGGGALDDQVMREAWANGRR